MMTDFHYFILSLLLSPLVAVFYSWVGEKWKNRRQKKIREQIETLHNRISDGEIFIKNGKTVIIVLLYRIIDVIFEACFLIFLLCTRIALMIEFSNSSVRMKISGLIIQALAIGILLRISWRWLKIFNLYLAICTYVRHCNSMGKIQEHLSKNELDALDLSMKDFLDKI